MLQVEFNKQKGFISGVRISSAENKVPNTPSELILPWSIEFGDPASFFSLEQPGWRTVKNINKLEVSEAGLSGEVKVKMSTGEGILRWQDKVAGNKITRVAELEATSDMLLMDFVIQYRFKATVFDTGIIEGQAYPYANRNLYIQKPVSQAELQGRLLNKAIRATIYTDSTQVTEKFRPEMYIRDRNNTWIIHSRLMPNAADLETIKLNVKWYNRALPGWLAKALLSLPGVRKALWYRGELKGYPVWNPILRIFKPSAYAFATLARGEKLTLNTSVEFEYETI